MAIIIPSKRIYTKDNDISPNNALSSIFLTENVVKFIEEKPNVQTTKIDDFSSFVVQNSVDSGNMSILAPENISENSVITIAGYNYGAKQYSRVKEVFWQTAKLGTVVTTICFAIGMFIPRLAAGIFTHDEALLDMSAEGMRILTLGFPIVGFQMIGTNFFQSLGMVKKSIILSLSRQILFLLPMLYALPLWYGANGVWMSFPISDVLSALLTAILLRRLFRKFNRLQDGEEASILGSNI